MILHFCVVFRIRTARNHTKNSEQRERTENGCPFLVPRVVSSQSWSIFHHEKKEQPRKTPTTEEFGTFS